MSSAKWRPFCLGLNVLTIRRSVLIPIGVRRHLYIETPPGTNCSKRNLWKAIISTEDDLSSDVNILYVKTTLDPRQSIYFTLDKILKGCLMR